MSVFEPSEAVQIYEPFASDFGPLNLSCTYKFCQQTKRLLQVAIILNLQNYIDYLP